MKISKNTILKYSPYTTALTKAVKNADRLHCQRVNDDVYICDGKFAARLNLSEYDVLVRPVTQRDAGDYVMRDGEIEDGSNPVDIADILCKVEQKGVSALTLTPFMIGASNRKKNEAVMVTYYSTDSDFVLGLNSDYDAMIKPGIGRSSKKSVSPVLFFNPDYDEPYAMILPVKMQEQTADAIRAYYKPQQSEQENLDRLEMEKWELERENEESQRVISRLREELKESRECILTLEKQARAADTSRKEKTVPSVQLCGDSSLELEDNLTVAQNFEWVECPATSLPSGLKVLGDMDIDGAKSLTALPNDLEVRGYLNACDSALTVFPASIKVGGKIDLSFTPLERFEAQEVNGRLDLCKSRVTYLPDGLSVKEDLILSATPIKTLPKRLTVGGNLILTNTSISLLPDDLEVGGNLDIRGTDVKTIPESIKVGGEILTDFPEDSVDLPF